MQNIPSDQENYKAPSDTEPSLGTSSEDMDGKSSIGIKPNIAAALSYALVWAIGCISSLIIGFKIVQDYGPNIATTNDRLLIQIQMTTIMYLVISGVITLGAGCIFFLMEKESRVVRLHSMQAILFGVLWFAASIILSVMGMALGAGIALLSIPVSIAFLVVWILLMVKAYKGDMLKLPVISNIAENIVTK